ncbi:MAG: hypothetical protein UX28_C0003G0126 [Candidatus Pacebacteria bacterium GW2011_GWA1_46_10]|nr:MAG: hypothetical protein UX28_C0003G0126 [Candidatus Pacebacteria bacterium GW2011_GWA1_46_10]HCR81574.1 hypothetical protein [Candidatus Paceibacterota bacterium]
MKNIKKVFSNIKNSVKNYDHGILPFLGFLIILFFAYRIVEWHQLTRLNELQKEVELEEISFANNAQDENDTINNLIGDYFSHLESSSSAEMVIEYNLVSNEVKINDQRAREYIAILQENRQNFQNIDTFSKFFITKNGKFIDEYVDLAFQYYDAELNASNRSLIESDVIKNLSLIFKDRAILNEFVDNYIGESEDLISQNFNMVSPLEKYTRSDFVFDGQDVIEQNYSYFSETLAKQKKLFGDTYLMLKDLAVGDYDSASYKYEAIARQEADFNLDWDRVMDELFEEHDRLQSEIANININKLNKLYSFSDNDLGRYPILPHITSWETRAMVCNLIWYKTNIYSSYKDEYPDQNNLADFLNELDKVPPSFDSVKNKTDFEEIKFSNNDSEIRFECNSNTDETLNFSFYVKKTEEN